LSPLFREWWAGALGGARRGSGIHPRRPLGGCFFGPFHPGHPGQCRSERYLYPGRHPGRTLDGPWTAPVTGTRQAHSPTRAPRRAHRPAAVCPAAARSAPLGGIVPGLVAKRQGGSEPLWVGGVRRRVGCPRPVPWPRGARFPRLGMPGGAGCADAVRAVAGRRAPFGGELSGRVREWCTRERARMRPRCGALASCSVLTVIPS